MPVAAASAARLLAARRCRYCRKEYCRAASVACTALKCRLLNIRTGVAMATPSENCPTIVELPTFASITTIASWHAAYTTLPDSTHAKFERRDNPAVGTRDISGALMQRPCRSWNRDCIHNHPRAPGP